MPDAQHRPVPRWTTVAETNGTVDGSVSPGPGAGGVTGLSHPAERPRSEATGPLAAMPR